MTSYLCSSAPSHNLPSSCFWGCGPPFPGKWSASRDGSGHFRPHCVETISRPQAAAEERFARSTFSQFPSCRGQLFHLGSLILYQFQLISVRFQVGHCCLETCWQVRFILQQLTELRNPVLDLLLDALMIFLKLFDRILLFFEPADFGFKLVGGCLEVLNLGNQIWLFVRNLLLLFLASTKFNFKILACLFEAGPVKVVKSHLSQYNYAKGWFNEY